MSDPIPHPDAPRAVAWLGYGGLLPFLAAAGALLAGVQSELARQALLAYGAAILSFVGALHWGFAMMWPQLPAQEGARLFAWSTVPALAAWVALMLPPAGAATLLMAGFVAHYVQDRRLAARHPLPAWYLPLRLRLSAVACLCLLTILRP